MKYKLAIAAAGLVALATSVFAQDYTIGRPDIFGTRHISGPQGFSGTINRPDIFGQRTFQYNNGVSGTISRPDIFGNSTLRYNPTTMPRHYGNW